MGEAISEIMFCQSTERLRKGESREQLMNMAMHRVKSSDLAKKGHELWGAVGCTLDAPCHPCHLCHVMESWHFLKIISIIFLYLYHFLSVLFFALHFCAVLPLPSTSWITEAVYRTRCGYRELL